MNKEAMLGRVTNKVIMNSQWLDKTGTAELTCNGTVVFIIFLLIVGKSTPKIFFLKGKINI